MCSFEIIESIIISIAAIVASIMAVKGISVWRNEFLGKKKIELAEEIIILFYQCKDHIRMIRSPFSYTGEGKTRKTNSNETDDESKLFDKVYVVFERYNKVNSDFNKLFSLKYKYKVVLSEKDTKPFKDFQSIIQEIFSAANLLGRVYWEKQYTTKSKEEKERFNKDREKYERIFWEINENDEINQKINDAILIIEEKCSKFIK